MRFRLLLAYDGTAYNGWQRQPSGLPSIQQTIEEALLPFARHGKEGPPPGFAGFTVVGSGRTDAGVHAHGQVAHVNIDRDLPPVALKRALNVSLPADIRVLDVSAAAPDFHAQFSTHGKEYRYFVWNGEVLPPDRRLYAAHVRNPLDIAAMRDAAARFVGEHDFAAFTANPHRTVASTVRTVRGIDVVAEPAPFGTLVEFRVCGNGFLYKMVRSIVGFLLAVGLGRERPENVDEVMASRVRTARVESAPPQGLFLWSVQYPGE